MSENPSQVIEQLMGLFGEQVRMLEERLPTEDIRIDIDARHPVVLEGYAEEGKGGGRRRVRVMLDEEACLVILPKKVAMAYGLQACNNKWEMCIWDPVRGTVVCTR